MNHTHTWTWKKHPPNGGCFSHNESHAHLTQTHLVFASFHTVSKSLEKCAYTYIHTYMHIYIYTHTHTYAYICTWCKKPGLFVCLSLTSKSERSWDMTSWMSIMTRSSLATYTPRLYRSDTCTCVVCVCVCVWSLLDQAWQPTHHAWVGQALTHLTCVCVCMWANGIWWITARVVATGMALLISHARMHKYVDTDSISTRTCKYVHDFDHPLEKITCLFQEIELSWFCSMP
jgi:hypothetical protein